ncbi:MAG: protein kinase [Verrucomicrobia subdivision 3 bacterium]|nr:protein kinase [Limisphaerales bacterium]
MPKPTPTPPEIPGHTLHRQIGAGGYGTVWLAQSNAGTDTGVWRAIKVVRRDAFGSDKPYLRELRAVQAAAPVARETPELATLHETGEGDGWFYCTLDLADNAIADDLDSNSEDFNPENYTPRTLAQQLDTHDRLPFADCLHIAETLATALGALHARGLVHCDVKPSNIIYIAGQPRLADVGLVRTESSAATAVGTAGYVPPEGVGRPAGDLFALGVALYEMATGRDRMEFPSFPTLSGEERTDQLLALNEVIVRACHPEPTRRYPSAEAMAEDLRRLAQGRPLAPQRRPALWAIAAGILLFTAVAWSVLNDSPPENSHDAPAAPAAPAAKLPAPDAPHAGPATLAKNLIGYYPFHGDTRDHSRHGHHAVAQHITWATDRLGIAHGALQMTGRKISRVDVSSFPVNGPGLSFCFWLHPFDTICFNHQLVSHNWANGGAFKAELRNGRLTGSFRSDDGEHEVTIETIRSHAWQHVAFTFTPGENGEAVAWLNGQAIARSPATGRIGASPHPLTLGAQPPGYAGLLENLRIYNRALDAPEMKALHQAESAPPASPRSVDWDFNYQFQSVQNPIALRYLAATNNVKRITEDDGKGITYWAPARDREVGTLTYRFPFGPRRVRRAHFSCWSHSWDFEASQRGNGRGAIALAASRDGKNWTWLHDQLRPQPKWGGAAFYFEDLPAETLGGTNLWLRVQMLTTNLPPDATYSTAHHAESKTIGPAFELKVVFEK